MKKKLFWTSVSTVAFLALLLSSLFILFNQHTDLVVKTYDILLSLGQLIGLACILATIKYKELVKHRLLMAGLALLIIAVVMKLLHLQYTVITLFSGTIISIIAVLLRLLKKEKREFLSIIKSIWFIVIVLGAVFKLNHYPGANKLLMVASFLIWIIIISYAYQFENKQKPRLYSN
jgi:hypothetical protein